MTLKCLADEEVADDIIIEAAHKRIKTRRGHMRTVLSATDGGEVPVKAENVEKNVKSTLYSAGSEDEKDPDSAVLKLLRKFKNQPHQGSDCIACVKCGGGIRAILSSCMHFYCFGCFNKKLSQAKIKKKKSIACHYHTQPGQQTPVSREIDDYFTLAPFEVLELKKLMRGTNLNLKQMAEDHNEDIVQRRIWSEVVSATSQTIT